MASLLFPQERKSMSRDQHRASLLLFPFPVVDVADVIAVVVFAGDFFFISQPKSLKVTPLVDC